MTSSVEEFLAKAAAEPVTLTIRELLTLWDFRARNYDSVGRIQRDLSAADLTCQPDFAEGPADTVVRLGRPAPRGEPAGEAQAGDGNGVAGYADGSNPEIDEIAEQRLELPPVSLLVRDIPSATGGITPVAPSQTLLQAQTLMIRNDYSQLPVLDGPRDLKGCVSWRSIAMARIAKSDIQLADVTDHHPAVVHADQELLEQINVIYEADFVFVQDSDGCICGIVTTADLSGQFRDLTTPFFQLGEIEGRLRRCISAAFKLAEIRGAISQSKLKSVEAMTFWQYELLLRDQDRWQRMYWQVDREMFIAHLDDVRKIRNRVMHFGVQLANEDRKTLLSFLHFMRSLDPLP